MIKRIKKIINIGRFSNCLAPGCEFKNETIIFGLNTQGKSTITAILRSIQTNNNDILIGRKTFGVAGTQNIEIDFEQEGVIDKYVFQNCAWNKTNQNIHIFDSKFIADNVFNGESITFDQQKNLNTIIIGKKGQELNNEIIALQEKSEYFANKKTEMTKEFFRYFPGIDFAKFKSYLKDDDIDNKIKDKEKEIKFEQGKEEIKKLIKSHIISLSSIRFNIKDTLIRTLDAKQEEIERHIKSHFATDNNAQSFLSEGLGFLKKKPIDGSLRSCVFCGQKLEVEAEQLISTYATYFKGGYKDLQNEIAKAIDYFKSVGIGAILEKIAFDLKTNDLDIGLTDTKIDDLVNLKVDFEKEIDKKRDLNYIIDFDSFNKLKSYIEEIKTDLGKLEQDKLNIASPKTILQLESEKKYLEIIKKRHENTWIKFCFDWDTIEADADKVRAEREKKRKELEIYSTSIFDTHKETINSLCTKMGASFEIEDFKALKKIVGKDERIFTIKFFGKHKVSIDSEDEKAPNFKNTLSESDKRLLAFAFFISLLMHDHELDNKIVIFDDPVSSFDSERSRKTVHCITDIACKYKDAKGVEVTISPRQKIILTHEERFAKSLKRLMPGACTLKIEEYLDGVNKRSMISHANFDRDFPDDDISYRTEKIKKILDTRIFTTPFEEDCRIVLEHIFKRKYYLELRDLIENKKSIRTFTNKLIEVKVGSFEDSDKSKKFIRLCDDLNIELHDNGAYNSSGDKESIIKDFFDCLKLI
ncbi:MAG: AAA family ATPase [Candidatus Pacebacteria bacterium]|nr:AAA family ATPase [Candidatus Paceibacterota bacterium]